VSIRERNREKYDLPTVFSVLIYTHPETGFPLAICDGSYHTVMRTGAAGAVSAKWMARQNSKRLAIVGAGHMAEGTLATCNEIFRWEEVRVWSRTQATLDRFMETQQPKFPHLKIYPSTELEQVVRGADVVVTVTPARGPIVMDDWIAPGTHIAAIGADIAGEIGEVVTGKKPGRTFESEITLFDSTGIALQDSATVPLEYERAVAAGVGVEKKMIST
jgi:alanine dehydrogenase